MSQSRASSTTPGEQSPPPAMQQSQSRARRGRSRTPRSVSASGSEFDEPRRRRRGGRQGGGGGPLGGGEGGPLGQLPGIGEAGETVNGLTKGATDTLGGLGKNALGGVTGGGGEQKEEGGGDDTLKLRLDLNLDVWVELKAKVHGDVTLSLLNK